MYTRGDSGFDPGDSGSGNPAEKTQVSSFISHTSILHICKNMLEPVEPGDPRDRLIPTRSRGVPQKS